MGNCPVVSSGSRRFAATPAYVERTGGADEGTGTANEGQRLADAFVKCA
jgi:hypothetical protein